MTESSNLTTSNLCSGTKKSFISVQNWMPVVRSPHCQLTCIWEGHPVWFWCCCAIWKVSNLFQVHFCIWLAVVTVTWNFVWLWQTTEELRHQLAAQQKVIEQHKSHINKCIDVVKKLLKEKSNIEKKEARQKCMQNRLRLGQFVTQRVGATFQENWTDGYAFQELARYVYYLFPRCFLLVGIMYNFGSSKWFKWMCFSIFRAEVKSGSVVVALDGASILLWNSDSQL